MASEFDTKLNWEPIELLDNCNDVINGKSSGNNSMSSFLSLLRRTSALSLLCLRKSMYRQRGAGDTELGAILLAMEVYVIFTIKIWQRRRKHVIKIRRPGLSPVEHRRESANQEDFSLMNLVWPKDTFTQPEEDTSNEKSVNGRICV